MIGPGPVHVVRRAGVAELTAAGVASPEFDAIALLAATLEMSPGMLPVADDVTADQASAYAALIRRRAQREPLQHIVGTAGFYGIEIAVGPGVFIPRPETELLVEHAIGAIDGLDEPVVIDLCSGSGAIPIAIALRRPTASVSAVELSDQALPWLRRNVEALAPAVRIVTGDVLDQSLDVLDERALRVGGADLVTCNPPYVPEAVQVDSETDQHDPAMAVFAGADGLDLIRPLGARIAGLLRPGGVVLLEHDESHQDAVIALFERSGEYAAIDGLRDLAGRPRFVRATRS